MPNATVPAAAIGLPAITRRALAAGLAAFPTLAFASPAVDRRARIVELADELSLLLARDGLADFCIRVSPALDGEPCHALQPARMPARARLAQSLAAAGEALQQLRPGAWRVSQDIENGLVSIVADACEIA